MKKIYDSKAKQFLYENVKRDLKYYWGVQDKFFLEEVVNNWFDDNRNYDTRWHYIESKYNKINSLSNCRILDIACGCGTFVLYGLKRGYDVYGVDPEPWKLEFIKRRMKESNYPAEWQTRFIQSFGETLPFRDEVFDLITTYQTLEHVQDVKKCLFEMLRTLKVGGVLYIIAPDYNSFYEGHYRVFWLPLLNRKLARFYLTLIGRPTRALDSIQYIAKGKILKSLRSTGMLLKVIDINKQNFFQHEEIIRKRLRKLFGRFFGLISNFVWIVRFLNYIYELASQIMRIWNCENTFNCGSQRFSERPDYA